MQDWQDCSLCGSQCIAYAILDVEKIEWIAVGSPIVVLFIMCDSSSGAAIHTVDAR